MKEVKSNNFHNSDIVILTRKKADGIQIANYLNEREIPVVSSESLLLSNSEEIKCIIALLTYIENKNDLLAKANFLYYFAHNLQEKLPVDDFIFEGKNKKSEIDFQNWLIENSIDFSFIGIRKKSLYESVELIVSKILSGKNYDAYVNFFLDLVFEQDIKRQSGITEFLEYWNSKAASLSIPQPEENDAVRIMTIHKSKGLEFPVVIFPFAEEDYTRGPKEKIWLAANENEIGIGKALVDLNQKVKEFGNEAAIAYHKKSQEDLLDDMNILYVAFTRAQEQLHIISRMNTLTNGKLPNNMSSYFIKFLKHQHLFQEELNNYKWGASMRLSELNEKDIQSKIIEPVKSSLKFESIKIAQKESILWGTEKQKAIDYGDVLHEILSSVITKKDIDTAIAKAIENGLITVFDSYEIKEVIEKIVNHKELKDYFNDDFTVLNEKTIISVDKGVVIPDRIVIGNENQIFLLDYKTGKENTKHKQQLDDYQNSIEAMGFKVLKKILVYVGEEIMPINV
jgi:ATP-dependent exoDNAse (exonuclease V) beta subunit